MRNLNQDILNQRQGLEPFTVVGIAWKSLGETYYGDIDYPNDNVHAKIINLPELNQSMNADGTGVASSITVKFDDTDGSILGIINIFDVYLAPVTVYQCFRGHPIDFNVKMFEGSIVGPVTWDEGTRTVEIQCTTRFTNIQVGVWYDETNTDILHQSLIGKTWPMPFGTPIHYPALQLQEIPNGITTVPFGVPDISILWQVAKIQAEIDKANAPYLAMLESLISAQAQYGSKIQDTFNAFYIPLLRKEMAANSKSLQDQADSLIATYAEQSKYALTSNVILGGYKFPQQVPLMCRIGEQLFTCTFLGNPTDHITNPNQACPVKIVPFYPAGYPNNSGNNNVEDKDYSYHFSSLLKQYGGSKTVTTPNQKAQVAQISVGGGGTHSVYSYSQTEYIGGISNYPTGYPVVKSGFTWISPGSNLSLVDDFDFAFLVSAIPGTVINVFAYKGFNGLRQLVQVPDNYYRVQTSGNITYVVMKKPLSIISYLINERTTEAEAFLNQQASDFNGFVSNHVVTNVDWEDQIYVTFQSSIGPNIVDILTWLIINYTPYNYDWTSFNLVRGIVANYPANFVIMEHPLVDSLMNDIAYQSRCSLILKDGLYYLTYLSGNPWPVGFLQLDAVAEDSLQVTTTPIEDIITRYVATWRPDYSPDYATPNQVILRNNEQRYGIIETTKDFYIYNQFYLVKKSALFWMLRTSNIFKIVKFNVFLDNLNYEVNDAVILDFPPVFANIPVTGIITNLGYDTENYTISLTFWTPVKIGQMQPYLFAWPAGLTETDYYFPANLTTGGASLGYSPGNIPPPPPLNQIAQQTVDYSSWPDLTADYNDYVKRASDLDAEGRSAQAEAQRQQDAESGQNTGDNGPHSQPTNANSDAVDPANNANQRNSHIPIKEPISNIPVNPKISPQFSVAPTTTPTIPSNSGGSSNAYPAQIISGSGTLFQANVFTKGLNGEPTPSPVNEVHNDSTLVLDPGIWVTVLEVSGAYYVVQPSWSH